MKRTLFLLFILSSFSSLFWTGCTQEKLTPVCDTQNMSYKYNIVPILKSNCYGCHSTGNTTINVGIVLDNYDSLAMWARLGYLGADITHTSGFVGMPYMRPKLDSCTINQILAWKEQGTLNN